MIQDFSIWFGEGLRHILDLEGYDHICYVSALAILYSFWAWKALLIQVTAFTIGHSLSLAASVTELVKIPQSIIEIIIPITIIITCCINLFSTWKKDQTIEHQATWAFAQKINYVLALVFGLIHGLGFSYLLKSMLGQTQSILGPLFAFNLGLEAGQIIIVSLILLATLAVSFLKIPSRFWTNTVSVIILGISCLLLFERI